MKILIIGGGSFGTAMAQELASNRNLNIRLLFKTQIEADSFNAAKINQTYFPNRPMDETIIGVFDWHEVKDADAVFIAVPAKNIPEVAKSIRTYLQPNTLVVNLAKGIFENGETLVEYLEKELKHPNIVSLKGPSFAAEMINRQATLMTLGFTSRQQLSKMREIIVDTNIFLDYTSDIRGVELLSALKNIYAILLGNVDAQYNSANTRFMMLTKAFAEIKLIVRHLGGKKETVNLGCGIGDISLTGLNDLSRNRTLGLLIGKGFYSPGKQENSVVLEGLKTLNLVKTLIPENLYDRLPLLQTMIAFFLDGNKDALQWDFEELFKKRYKTVLTYGTFDLLHFGHLEILRRAKDFGDELIVGLSTDEFNLAKGKKCKFSYAKRKEFLESLAYVDQVIPEDNWEQKIQDVKDYEVDVFIMGHDWEGKFDFLKEYCEVHYLPRTKGISTTQIKELLKKEN